MLNGKSEALASLARQLEERAQDDALTPVMLSVEHAAELLESLRKLKPWERCSIHGPAEDRVWACPACLVELRTEVEALRADAERYRWLTDDHSKHETREAVHQIGLRLSVSGKGRTDAAIDLERGKSC